MLDPASPPRLRRFELVEALGSGNTGTIYLARARVGMAGLQPGDEVAVKLLHPQLLGHEAAREAFLREARAGMRVRHPSLVRVYAVEEIQGPSGRLLYLVLERLRGRTVRDWLREEGLASEPTLRALARQIAGALAALHEAELLHLDVKPENLMWDEDRAVLMDLGFVRHLPRGEGDELESGFLGTPAYSAPEVLRGLRPTAAADLFSLGVTLYESATGVRPFGDERAYGLFEARRTAVVRKPSTIQPRLSRFFDEIVMKLLAEDPEERFASAAVLETVLREGEHGAWWSDRAEVRSLLPLLHPDALPFTGRRRELRILGRAFRRARNSGRPQLLILHGEGGIGKTRLAMEFARRWRERPESPPFLYGRCPRITEGSALAAVRDALARSLGLAPGQPPTESVEHRLRSALPKDSAATLLTLLRGGHRPRGERRIAFREWFRALGREGPFLILLDDLQAAGDDMWTFLGEVLELENVPGLFLVAHRPDLHEAAAGARQALLGHPHVSELELGFLDREEVAEVLHEVFRPGALGPELLAALIDGAGGSPGVLHELLRYLRQRGDLRGAPGALRPARKRIVVPPSRTQEQVLHVAIEELDAESRNVLQWATYFPSPLRVRLLAAASGLSEARTARVLSKLRRDGWLNVVSGYYRFDLPATREAVYRSLDPEARRERHAVAFHLLVGTGLQVVDRGGQIALHAHRAGLHEEALRHGLPILERKLANSAFAPAERALRGLREHMEALGEDEVDASVRCRLLLAEAQLRGVAGDREREGELLKEAGLLATRIGDDALRGKVHLGLALQARALGFAGAARVHLERARALRVSPEGGDRPR